MLLLLRRVPASRPRSRINTLPRRVQGKKAEGFSYRHRQSEVPRTWRLTNKSLLCRRRHHPPARTPPSVDDPPRGFPLYPSRLAASLFSRSHPTQSLPVEAAFGPLGPSQPSPPSPPPDPLLHGRHTSISSGRRPPADPPPQSTPLQTLQQASVVTAIQLLQMLQGSNISNQKTLYEVLSVSEDATYDEIRAAYKSAALSTHPDKAQTTLDSFVSPGEQHGFFGVQEAWEILRYPKSRAEYDTQLRSSRQSIEIIASDIEIDDMTVESSADGVELLYACRCGDYFSITSCELGEMGILVGEDGEIELQAPDSVSTSVVLGCGSCSLKARLVISKT